jgi:hypothetical protein
MKTLEFENLSDGRAQLRALIATINQEMLILSGQLMRDDPHATSDRLLASWATLVKLLALGPVAETRVCPVCRHTGMRNATRCGYCWTKLSPLAGAAPLVVAAESAT